MLTVLVREATLVGLRGAVWADVYGQARGCVPADDPQDLFQRGREVMQNHRPARVVTALVKADDHSQGS